MDVDTKKFQKRCGTGQQPGKGGKTKERMGTQEKDITEEEEDEGPPPGFQCLTSQTEEKLVKQEKVADINENNEDDEDIEGPPPGWSSIPPATHQPIHPSGEYF